jgi:acetyl-CoA acetyltransferase
MSGGEASPRAAIAGMGATPYYFRGASYPQTLYELVCKSVLAAVADAGIELRDIDGMACFSTAFEPALITQSLGIPELTFAAQIAGQGGGSAGILDLAAMAVADGRARTVVCLGGCQQTRLRYGAALGRQAPDPESIFARAAGISAPGEPFALLARRHMHKYGTRREAFAEVVLNSRRNAADRPQALRKKPLSLDEYMAAPLLADPLCRYDFCLETDGVLAFIVTAPERARDLKQKPVYIAASAHGGSRDWGRAFFWLNMPDEVFASAGAEPVARRLYAEAGITPADIDVALVYDHFSPLVVMQLEDYGFCARGEGGAFVESGAIRMDGAIPVNPHGGQLSEAYIYGMTHIREAVEQLRGTAQHQIPDARFALVTGGPAPIPCSGAILRN